MNRLFCIHTGKRYGLLARRCARSFAQFGVDVKLIEVKNKEDWMRNCLQRVQILNEMSQKYPRDGVGLLDSDLTCMRRPEKLVEFSGDIAVHDLTDTQPGKTHPTIRFSAGVSMFGVTPNGRACLRKWGELCLADKNHGDMLREQIYLHQAIQCGLLDQWGELKKKDALLVTNLGEAYNRVINRYVKNDDTVILHHVASRKLRKSVGGIGRL